LCPLVPGDEIFLSGRKDVENRESKTGMKGGRKIA